MTDPKETPRVLTEGEAYAIAAAEVKRETAERDQRITELESEKAALRAELEAELAKRDELHEAALAVEKQARETAEQALADFKASVEAEKTAAARMEERTAKVREVAKHLSEEFFTPERASRWAGMEDEAFTEYVRELAEVCKNTAPAAVGEAPRETAMAGTTVSTEKKTGNLAVLWGVN